MWDWLSENADAVTAVVAVAGLVLATGLSLVAIRLARRTSVAEHVDRQDQCLTQVLDRVVEFQHPALLPYWKATPEAPIDPESAEAHEVHRAVAAAASLIGIAQEVRLAHLDAELRRVRACLRVLYDFAQAFSPDEEQLRREQLDRGAPADACPLVQPWASAWSETSARLRHHGVTGSYVERLREGARKTYRAAEVGRLQLADACLDVACSDLVAAYARTSDRRPPG